jgi:hypothetical protein
MNNLKLGAVLAALVLGAGFLVVAPGCEKSGSKCVTNGTVVEISGNHGHTADVPADAVKRGIGGTYAVKGADHEHALVLKDDDMKSLQKGQAVRTRTSSVNGHLHEVEIRCKD